MTPPGRIILLNGAGSAGKSAIAKALQAIARETWLHVAMDDFLEMLPEHSAGTPDGLAFETTHRDGFPVVEVHSGPAVARLLAGMRAAVAALARAGNNVVVDDVMLAGEIADYRRVLAGLDWNVVGVHAQLAELEARERQRGDRLIGLARAQHDRVHAGMAYDLDIDTSTAMPLQCAERIKVRFGL